MKRPLLVAVICICCAASCTRESTPSPAPTAKIAPLQTAAPIIATPPPGPALALRAYMHQVHERVLLEYARRVTANRDLMSGASSRSFDADTLCPGTEGAAWQHFEDLQLEASVIVVPPLGEEFHTALRTALAVAQESAESYDWFCATYDSFGQPADGMWSRLSLQVRACESRTAELRRQWVVLGGGILGLVW